MTQTGPIAVRPPAERPGSARAVVVIGAGPVGLPAIGEQQAQAAIRYRMPDVLGSERERFANRRVAVLGAGHYAVGTILDLVALRKAEPDTSILWLVRGSDTQRAFGGGDKDQIAARGAIGTGFRHLVEGGKIGIESGFRVSRITQTQEGLTVSADAGDGGRRVTVDRLVVATGFRPDHSFTRELRLGLDPIVECPPELAPLIARAAHRPECPLLRDRAPARRARARASRGGFLHRWHGILRARADLSDDHGIRAGAFVRRRIGRGLRGGGQGGIGPPRDGVCSAPLDAVDAAGCCEPAASAETEGCCAPAAPADKAECCS